MTQQLEKMIYDSMSYLSLNEWLIAASELHRALYDISIPNIVWNICYMKRWIGGLLQQHM